jgi:hypothetical protein
MWSARRNSLIPLWRSSSRTFRNANMEESVWCAHSPRTRLFLQVEPRNFIERYVGVPGQDLDDSFWTRWLVLRK